MVVVGSVASSSWQAGDGCRPAYDSKSCPCVECEFTGHSIWRAYQLRPGSANFSLNSSKDDRLG